MPVIDDGTGAFILVIVIWAICAGMQAWDKRHGYRRWD